MSKKGGAFTEFFTAFDERKKKEDIKNRVDDHMVAKKRAKLAPIKKMFDSLVEFGLVVKDAQIGNPGVSAHSQKEFKYYEHDSSPSWAPGVSLFFDHPAEVEIAIPNDGEIPLRGEVVIQVASRHRDAGMLEQKFDDLPGAREALARFLGKNTISIKHDPRAKGAAKQAESTPMSKAQEHLETRAPEGPPAEDGSEKKDGR